MASNQPTRISNYTITRTLGSGVSGCVYLGTDSKGVQVAIKRLYDENPLVSSSDEASLMKTYAKHPNLVYLIETFSLKTGYHIVLNYVGKDNLMSFVNREGALIESEARKVFQGLLKGVHHLHSAGVVHRDLKCENILISEEEEDVRPVICDLGFAAHWSPHQLLHEFCGSIHYAAPEILNHRPYVGPEIDIWSLGVVLYAIIARQLPWEGDRAEIIQYASVGDYWLIDSFSPELILLLDHLLEPVPVQRAHFSDIQQSAWYRDGLDESAKSITNHLGISLSSESSKLFASGRHSGRSLFSSKRSNAPQRIDVSARFKLTKNGDKMQFFDETGSIVEVPTTQQEQQPPVHSSSSPPPPLPLPTTSTPTKPSEQAEEADQTESLSMSQKAEADLALLESKLDKLISLEGNMSLDIGASSSRQENATPDKKGKGGFLQFLASRLKGKGKKRTLFQTGNTELGRRTTGITVNERNVPELRRFDTS